MLFPIPNPGMNPIVIGCFRNGKKDKLSQRLWGLGRDAHVPSIEERFMDMTGSGKVSSTGKNRAQLGEWGTLGEG